jgi:hypothetical protein
MIVDTSSRPRSLGASIWDIAQLGAGGMKWIGDYFR